MVFVAILVATALILVNAVYVAAEFAAVSVRQSRLRQMAEDGHPFARWLLPRLGTPAALDRYIAACQIGITISSLGLGAYAQSTLAVWLAPQLASLRRPAAPGGRVHRCGDRLLVLTAAQVIFGELVPKSLASSTPPRRRSTPCRSWWARSGSTARSSTG
jgi:CBS domain containing-hemolysin-like protein